MKTLIASLSVLTIAGTWLLVHYGEQPTQPEKPTELYCSAETAAAGPSLEIVP